MSTADMEEYAHTLYQLVKINNYHGVDSVLKVLDKRKMSSTSTPSWTASPLARHTTLH